jgi:hypothetical protein
MCATRTLRIFQKAPISAPTEQQHRFECSQLTHPPRKFKQMLTSQLESGLNHRPQQPAAARSSPQQPVYRKSG